MLDNTTNVPGPLTAATPNPNTVREVVMPRLAKLYDSGTCNMQETFLIFRKSIYSFNHLFSLLLLSILIETLLPALFIHIFHILTTSSYCSLTIIIGNAGYTANIHADKHDDPLEMEDEDFRQSCIIGESLLFHIDGISIDFLSYHVITIHRT